MILRYFIIASVLSGLGACQLGKKAETKPDVPVVTDAAVKPIISDPQNANAADEQACSEFGGSYTRTGLLGYYSCIVDYADGGKVCSDASDCEGSCRATGLGNYGPDNQQDLKGTCQLNDSPFGCYTNIVDGELQPGLCVD